MENPLIHRAFLMRDTGNNNLSENQNAYEIRPIAKIKCRASLVGFTYNASPVNPLATMIHPIQPATARAKIK